MPVSPVQYHWAMSPSFVINPQIFTPYGTHIDLPAGATLRRILLAECVFYWKRASVSFNDQQAYFVNYEVVYGAQEGAPILYRATRRIPEVLVVNATGVTDVFCSIHSAADLEVGMNEKVQRGGYYAPPQELKLNWSIYSSGAGIETLAGQAAMPFRALYSTLVAP